MSWVGDTAGLAEFNGRIMTPEERADLETYDVDVSEGVINGPSGPVVVGPEWAQWVDDNARMQYNQGSRSGEWYPGARALDVLATAYRIALGGYNPDGSPRGNREEERRRILRQIEQLQESLRMLDADNQE